MAAAVFSDVVCESDNIVPTWTQQCDSRESSVQTTPVATVETGTDPIARCQSYSQTISTDWESEASKRLQTSVSDVDVIAFLNRVTPLLERELALGTSESICFQDYVVHWDEGRDSLERAYSLRRGECEPTTAVSWNSSGHVLAVAYGRNDHESWCRHTSQICTWNLAKRDLCPTKPDSTLEVECCVSTIAFHPERPAILAAGLFIGKLCVWDLSNETDNELAKSDIGDLKHREPIAQLAWVRDLDLHSRSKHSWALATISGDGKVLFWRLENELRHPVSGARLVPTKRYYGHGLTMNKNPILGGCSISISPFVAGLYAVGTEGGGVLRCNRAVKAASRPDVRVGKLLWSAAALDLIEDASANDQFELKRHVEKNAMLLGLKRISVDDVFASEPPGKKLYSPASNLAFKPHIGAVLSVQFSPFHRHVLLSCGAEGSLRIYRTDRVEPLFSLEPSQHSILDAKWSTSRPLVFACADAGGNLHVFDLLESLLGPALTIAVGDGKSAVVSIAFNSRDGGLLATALEDGTIEVWHLAQRLSVSQAGEQSALDRLVGQYAD